MNFRLGCNKIPFSFVAQVVATEPLFIYAQDSKKPNTVYMNRYADVSNGKALTLKFPQSPDEMFLTIESQSGEPIQVKNHNIENLKTHPLWKDGDLAEFIPFAQWFCENAGVFSATVYKNGYPQPSVYKSKNLRFRIDFSDFLTDYDERTGREIPTDNPACVGHSSGIISLSAQFFRPCTIPVRMAILMHEYCHKYVNPKSGVSIDNEKAADLNAINILLCLGYSEAEIEHAFLNVFEMANNEQNTERYNLICNFIDDFSNNKLAIA